MSDDGKLAPVTLIGAGIMGEALLSGLIASGVAPAAITIVEKRDERAQELCDRYGVIREELSAAVAKSGAILLVVKPQDLGSLLDEIKGFTQRRDFVGLICGWEKNCFRHLTF